MDDIVFGILERTGNMFAEPEAPTKDSDLPYVAEYAAWSRSRLNKEHAVLFLVILVIFIVIFVLHSKINQRLDNLSAGVDQLRGDFLVQQAKANSTTAPVAAQAKAEAEAAAKPEASAEEFVNGPRNVFAAAVGGSDPFETFRGGKYDDQTLALSL